MVFASVDWINSVLDLDYQIVDILHIKDLTRVPIMYIMLNRVFKDIQRIRFVFTAT